MRNYLPIIIKKLRERKYNDHTIKEVHTKGYRYISTILYPINRWRMKFYYNILNWGINQAKENKDMTYLAEFYKDLSIMYRSEEKNILAAKYLKISLNLCCSGSTCISLILLFVFISFLTICSLSGSISKISFQLLLLLFLFIKRSTIHCFKYGSLFNDWPQIISFEDEEIFSINDKL